jgi:hypothetical protein
MNHLPNGVSLRAATLRVSFCSKSQTMTGSSLVKLSWIDVSAEYDVVYRCAIYVFACKVQADPRVQSIELPVLYAI